MNNRPSSASIFEEIERAASALDEFEQIQLAEAQGLPHLSESERNLIAGAERDWLRRLELAELGLDLSDAATATE